MQALRCGHLLDSSLQVVNYSTCVSAEEICEGSSKLITFIDLAGHQKYLKTTVFGLTAHCPDLAMLVVGANSGVGEYLALKCWSWFQLCNRLIAQELVKRVQCLRVIQIL